MRQQFTILSIAILLLAGCTTPRQMTLFSGASSTDKIMEAPQYIIEPGDLLSIHFSAINAEAIAPYNSAGTSYQVRHDGTVDMPVLGAINLTGKTVDEAIELLTNMVRTDVREPMVRLSISNAVVTVLGEVERPSELSAVPPMTLLEALGRVGGLTRNARCKDVVIMRREQGTIHTYHVNLLTDEILTSPCYYLTKGDVVYVAPLHAK